jgi:adhesin/invasin
MFEPVKRLSSRATVLAVALFLLALVRCGGDSGSGPDPSKPAALSLVSGNAQTGTVGQPLAEALVVRVLNSQNQAVSGATVNWSVTAGGGGLSSAANTTDAQGNASVTWTLGTAAGASNNTARVTVNGLTGIVANFTASAQAGAATQLVAVSGNAQSAIVGEALAQPLVVVTRDQYGNGVSGKTVDWAVTQGAGHVSAASSTTDGQGQAAVSWTVGTTANGNQRVTASATGLTGSPLEFSASATAGAVTQLAINSGNSQSGEVNQALAQPIAIRAYDQYDNPVSGAPINWTVTGGGGSVAPLATQTNGLGLVSATWTVGTVAGSQSARARFGTAGPFVTFDATANAGPAAVIAAVSGGNQTAGITQPVVDALVIRVTDAYGNSKSGVSVTWAVTQGGGSIAPNSATTGSNGENTAAFKHGTQAGNGAQPLTAN